MIIMNFFFKFWNKILTLRRNSHLTDSRWLNEFDQTMTKTNLNNWTWPKLKPTNLNLMSGVSVPNVFSWRGAKWGQKGVPSSASVRAGAGGPIQADCTSIFLEGKVNVCRCHEFLSCSMVKVHHSEIFLVIF